MSNFVPSLLGLAFVLLLAGRPQPPVTVVRFINRSEVELTLSVDSVEFCTAQSFGKCEAGVPFGPHHLAANFKGRPIVTREAPAQDLVVFAVCHASDADEVCRESGGKK